MHAIEVIACGAGALGGGEAHIKLNFLCQIAKLGTIKLRSLSDYFKLFSIYTEANMNHFKKWLYSERKQLLEKILQETVRFS